MMIIIDVSISIITEVARIFVVPGRKKRLFAIDKPFSRKLVVRLK